MATFLLALFVVICLLLIVVVLLQKGRGGGLSAAFGGGLTSSAFGTRTGDVLTWVTIVLTGLFLLLAIVSTVVIRPPEAEIRAGLNPPPGAIEKDTPVSIVLPSRTKEDLRAYYTLDGTDPTDKSSQYMKEPILVQPGQVIKVRVMRRGRLGPVVEGQYPKPVPTTAPAPISRPASAPASAPGLTPETAPATPASSPAAGPPASAPAAAATAP